MASGMNHLDHAQSAVQAAQETVGEERMVHSQLAIAEALTGILELLTGVIGNRGSVLNVRVSGSVSTGDQR